MCSIQGQTTNVKVSTNAMSGKEIESLVQNLLEPALEQTGNRLDSLNEAQLNLNAELKRIIASSEPKSTAKRLLRGSGGSAPRKKEHHMNTLTTGLEEHQRASQPVDVRDAIAQAQQIKRRLAVVSATLATTQKRLQGAASTLGVDPKMPSS